MKSTHPYARAWFAAAALLLSLSGCNAGEPKTAEQDPYANVSPKEPIAIPFPLDKAGFEVDTTFWVVPGVPTGRSSNHHVALYMKFTPGDPTGRIQLMEESHVKVRVTLHRIEGQKESKVPIRRGVNIEPDPYKPPKIIAENLPNDIGEIKGRLGPASGTGSKDQQDSATMIYSFAGAELPPGRYRLRASTLQSISALTGIPFTIVVEHGFLSK